MRANSWAAFEEFVRAHGDALVRLSFALCGDRGKAEDAAQEALTRVYLRWSRLDDPLPYARRSVVKRAPGHRAGVRGPARGQGGRPALLGGRRQLPAGPHRPAPFTAASSIAESWLPKTAANVAQTGQPQVPAGFRQVPPSEAFH